MVSSKDKRHSGRYTPTATCSKKELIENNIEILIEYDDWKNYRDSMRDWFKDFKLIKHTRHSCACHPGIRDRMNKKQEKLIERRRARKQNI